MTQAKINTLNALLPQSAPFVVQQVSKALAIAEKSENFESNLDVAIKIAEQVTKFTPGELLYNYVPILVALLIDADETENLSDFDTIDHKVLISLSEVKQYLHTYTNSVKYAASRFVDLWNKGETNAGMVILAFLADTIHSGNNVLQIAYIMNMLTCSKLNMVNETYQFYVNCLQGVTQQEF